MFTDWFINFSIVHHYLIYIVIVLSAAFEGPILALVGGLLLRMGFLSLIPVYFALMMGDLVGDVFWYWIGHRFGHKFISRFGKYFRITEDSVATVKRIFHKHTDSILLISKLTMGLGFAVVTLVTAGMVGVPFRRYLALNVAGQFVWTALLLSVGFFVGHLYVTFDNIFARVSTIALSIIVIVALFQYGRYVKQLVLKRN